MMPNNNLLENPITDLAFIKSLLPHREPMLMVDGLSFYNDSKSVSQLTISGENLFVENNLFVESGLIEHMAQSAALMIGYKYHIQNLPIKEGFIAAIKNLKIDRLPYINDCISSTVEITYELANMTNVKIVTKLTDYVLASAEMTLVLKENE